MTNLHDVSWGNRPATQGTDAFTQEVSKQNQSKIDYQVFRTNFSLAWLLANGVYYILVLQLVDGVFASYQNPMANDGTWGYLEYFSFFIAFIVMFRVFFSTLYVIKWNFFYSCTKSYAFKKQNLDKAFKRVKQ